ncbi:MAG: hypothetical protein FJY21_09010 [Bacteroidetes bacterium]|nr:hypothetical protein [Bacteroidota bacterium]
MKKLIISTAPFVGLISAAYAQDEKQIKKTAEPGLRRNRFLQEMKSPGDRSKISTEAMEKRLNLSPEQKDQVYAINLERAEKMEKLLKSEMEMRKSHMQKRKEIMTESEKKLNKILTQEQQKTMEDLKQRAQERMKNRLEQRPGIKKG